MSKLKIQPSPTALALGSWQCEW